MHPLVSLLAILAFVVGSQIAGIKLDQLKMAETVKESTLLGLADFVSGGSCRNGSIFALSVLFMLVSRVLMNYMAAGIPFYRNVLANDKARFGRHVFCLDLVVAVALTAWLVTYLGNEGVVLPENGSVMRVVFLYWSGAVILRLLVAIVNKSILRVDGVVAVMAAGFLLSIGRWFADSARQNSEMVGVWTWVVIIGLFMAALAGAIFLERDEVRIPLESSRLAAQGGHRTGVNYVPVKTLSPFGGGFPSGIDRSFSTLLIFLIAYVSEILRVACAYYTVVLKILVGIVVPIVVSLLYLVQASLRAKVVMKSMVEQLRKSGGFIEGIHPGEATANYLQDKFANSISHASVFIVFGLLSVQIANLTGLPIPLHPLALVSLWAVVELCRDTYRGLALIKTERALYGSHYDPYEIK
jgi:preprotein translocase subunit SecY